MTIRTHFGCAGIRGPLATYARRFEVIELDVFPTTGKHDARPKESTLRRWRKEAGPSLLVSLVAPRALSAVRPGEALDTALSDLLEAQRLIQARFLLLATPTEVTPSQLNRERIAKVVERLREGLGEARDLVRIAWEPHGVWEPEDAARFARTLDVDLALDPLADPREPFFDSSLRYLRLGTVGGRTEYPPTRIRYLAEVLAQDAAGSGTGERVVVFATPHAPREAKRLKGLVESMSSRAPTAGGAVIRPRGSLSLPDEDE